MKKIIIFFIITLITPSLYSQAWAKTQVMDKWGEITGYRFMQSVTCTGVGANGKGTWNFRIIYEPNSEFKLIFFITPLRSDGFSPSWVILYNDVTISLRNGDNILTFIGIAKSTDLDSLFVVPSIVGARDAIVDAIVGSGKKGNDFLSIDSKILEALRSNIDYTILIEASSWWVRANIKGGMPIE